MRARTTASTSWEEVKQEVSHAETRDNMDDTFTTGDKEALAPSSTSVDLGSCAAASSASSGAAASTAVVNNPYAQKRSPTVEIRKPVLSSRELILHHLDLPKDKEGEPSEASTVDGDSETTVSNLGICATPRWNDLVMQQQQQQSCHRLRSKELPFGTAEIITIAEYLQKNRCDTLTFCDKSVRLTGKLVHRIVHSSSMVSLLLTDPLVVTATTATPKHQQQSPVCPLVRLGGRRSTTKVSFPKTPSILVRRRRVSDGVVPDAPLTTTPVMVLAEQNATSVVTSNDDDDDVSRKKRPRVDINNNNTNNSIDPVVECIVQAVTGGNCCWVVAHPGHVVLDDVSVGDLVMVLGTVQRAGVVVTDTNDDDNNEPLGRIAKQLGDESNCCYLAARIVRNVNGTDMKLFVQGLLARRQCLQALSKTDASTTKGNVGN
jgi:hypothetical protein